MIYTIDSKPIGKDANGDTVIWVSIEVDTIADLPAQNVFTGYSLCMGSKAHCIQDNSTHMLDSTGTWIQQQAGTASYTRDEINAMFTAFHNEVYGRGVMIPANTDLNTLTAGGVYYAIDNISTMQNVPSVVTGAFRLVVTELTTENQARIRQDIYPVGNSLARIVSRNKAGTSSTYPDGFRPWVVFDGISI